MDMPLEQARQYKGSSVKANDHDAFWQRSLAELDTLDPMPELVPAPIQFLCAQCFVLQFRSVGGAQIQAKFLCPRKPGKHPALLLFHGYTADSGDWLNLLPYAAEGFCVAALDCRGQAGGSADNGCYEGYTVRGHITRGLAGPPEGMLFRNIFLDTVLLARIVAAMPQVDSARMATMGNSQGGALSIACSALSGIIRKTITIHPWLSDLHRCMDLCRQPWQSYSELSDFFRRIDPLHSRETEFLEKLSYIDVLHLAPRIRNPVLMFLTQQDHSCPPSTQYAVYNQLTCEKRLVEYPDYDHEWPPQMSDLCYTFLRDLLKEVDV